MTGEVQVGWPATKRICGLVLYHDQEIIYLSRGYELLRSGDGGESLKRVATLPRSTVREQLARTPLGQRLVRGYIRHAVPAGPAGNWLSVLAGHRFFRLGPAETSGGHAGQAPKIEPGAFAVGKQPFHLAVSGGSLYYGEYRSNAERAPVGVYRSDDAGLTFRLHAEFTSVRHIHGVFADPWEEGVILAATGDDDEESAIWRIEERDGAAERLLGGSQRYRAVTLLPTKHHIYFGSDTPRERNYLYRLDRRSGKLETLAEVGGSVFWGRALPGGTIAFSTVVEPSEVNRSKHAELWVSRDGTSFNLARRYREDILHPKLFQYSQIRFPAGPGAADRLWISPFANWRHEKSECLDLSIDEERNGARVPEQGSER